jgi:hypothetical protein
MIVIEEVGRLKTIPDELQICARNRVGIAAAVEAVARTDNTSHVYEQHALRFSIFRLD